MSVSDGQSVNAAVTNAALMSRLNNTSTIGRVDVNNATDSTSPTDGALHTTGGAGVEKNLYVGQSVDVAANVTVGGTLDVAGPSNLSSVNATNVTATGTVQGNDVTATDVLTGNTLAVTTTATVGTDLTVSGLTQTQTLDSNGLATLNSATVETTLGVTGNTTLSTLSTTGLATLNSAQVTNNLTVQGNLTVNGTTTTVNSTVVDITDQNLTLNNLGSDATSEGAGLTIDRTGTSGSLIYKDASASKFAAGPLGSEIDLVNVSGSQTLTNKTISGASNTITNVSLTTGVTGTLPIANGGTGQITANAALNALLPTQTGNANRVLGTDGTNTSWVVGGGGSGGGGVNLIQNGDYENGIQIFTPYNDSSTTRPVDGTGGTPTVTANFLLSPAIRGTGSFVLSKPASNCQGQGWSIADTAIDPEFRAKPLRFSMAYRNNNANFVAGSNGSSPTDGDFIFTFYDLTNAKIVEPSNIKFFSNSQTLVDTFSCEVQFDSTCLSVRPIVHVASTSTLAIDMIVDSISLSPDLVNQGYFGTDWSAQETTSGTLTTNTTYNRKWRQEGDSIRERIQVAFSGAPGGTNPLQINTKFTIDTAKLNGGAISNAEAIGVANFTDVSTGIKYSGTICVGSSSTQIRINGDSNTAGNWGSTNPVTVAAGDQIEIDVLYPALGFSGNVKMSDSYSGREVSLKARLVPSTSVASGGIVPFTVVVYDKAGFVNTSTGRVEIKTAGTYVLGGFIVSSSGTAFSYTGRVNGAGVDNVGLNENPSGSSPLSGQFNLNAGDIFDIVTNAAGTNTYSGNLCLFRIDSPQSIAASEEIVVSARNASGQVFANNTQATITGWTIENNSHGFFDGTTGIFTARTARNFEIYAMISFADTVASGDRAITIRDLTNSSNVAVNYRPFNTAGSGITAQVVFKEMYLISGQQIAIQGLQTSGSNQSLSVGTIGERNILRIKAK